MQRIRRWHPLLLKVLILGVFFTILQCCNLIALKLPETIIHFLLHKICAGFIMVTRYQFPFDWMENISVFVHSTSIMMILHNGALTIWKTSKILNASRISAIHVSWNCIDPIVQRAIKKFFPYQGTKAYWTAQ